MVAESLSLKTDLIFWRHHGIVVDRGEYLVIQTPRNPTWRWGHVIAMKDAPTLGSLSAWAEIFTREFQSAPQPAPLLTWDQGIFDAADHPAVSSVHEFSVMVLTTLREPRSQQFEIRPVSDLEEWEQLARIGSATFGSSTASYEAFMLIRYALYRELAESGQGKFFGAFIDGHIVGGLGIFRDDDLWRFQEVVVLEQFRNNGIGSALIARAVKYAQAHSEAPTIVMCATAGGDAARLYSRLGFEQRERTYSLTLRAPENPQR